MESATHDEESLVRRESKPKAAAGRRAEDTWETIRGVLRRRLSRDAFHRWFRAARPGGVTDGELLVRVPNEIHQVWIETNYLPELVAAVVEALDGVHGVKLVVDPQVADDGEPEVAAGAADGGGSAEAVVEWPVEAPVVPRDETSRRLKQAALNPLFNFERFVVGANSQFAHAASIAVANGTATGFNPLFIHGGSGLGKTHLMQAIGQRWLRERPAVRVLYLSCERFTNEFIDAVRKGDIDRFRRRYRNVELLLLDDVQFLGGKERSQEEFFHTFNTLLDGQKQVVLTSDKPACEIKNLEPRLVSRFECGLTVELQVPQFETRLAILGRKMDEWRVVLDEEIVRFLAERIRSNVRRLEGALMRVATFSSLAGERVGVERVEHLLRDLLREEATRQVTIDMIQRAVAEHFDLRLADMTSRRRPSNIAFPRQVAMYLSRQLTKGSLVEIGEAFGGRDHGTVIHACRKVAERMETEGNVRDTVRLLESTLRR
jgi:chromosomal replication initiator protein